MKLSLWALVTCAVVGLAGCASPTTTSSKGPANPPATSEPKKEASNKEKIIGTWEPTKKEAEAPTIEFIKDGKMKMTVTVDGKPQTMEAAYTVDGDKITNIMKTPDGKEMKETATITKLTDTELVTKDEKGKIDEFKKKK
jgi:uncharacterized protein (TIGR03066 family)